MTSLVRAIDRHWFAPGSLRDLAAVRITVVAAQLLLLLLATLRPGHGPCPPCGLGYQLWLTGIDPVWYLPRPALKLLMLPFGGMDARPGPLFLQVVWSIAVVSGIGALLGALTRFSLLLFAAGNTLLIAHGYAYHEVHHTEALLVIVLWVLILAPSGRAVSLDALRRARRATGGTPSRPRPDDLDPLARWPLRLTQWLLALMYLSAALSKLYNGGLDWFNGYTISYYLLLDGLHNGRDLGIWLAGYPAIGTWLAIATVTIELTFFLAILAPALTWWYIAAGIAMHAAIYVLQGPPFFQTVVLYIAFIEPLRRHRPRFLARPAIRRRAYAGS